MIEAIGNEPAIPVVHQMTDEALRKLFQEYHDSALSRAQFESEKSKRIEALSRAVAATDPPIRNDLVREMLRQCEMEYHVGQTPCS